MENKRISETEIFIILEKLVQAMGLRVSNSELLRGYSILEKAFGQREQDTKTK